MQKFAALALLISCGIARAQSPSSSVDARTRAELEQARDAVWRSWFAGDIAALERLIPRALSAGSPESWEDRAKTLAQAKEFAASGGRLVELRFDSTTITLRGSVAFLDARYITITVDKAGKRDTTRGRAAEVFLRDKGRWVNPFWYLY